MVCCHKERTGNPNDGCSCEDPHPQEDSYQGFEFLVRHTSSDSSGDSIENHLDCEKEDDGSKNLSERRYACADQNFSTE